MSVKSGGGRPERYVTKDGQRVPGATTVIGRWKESGGLIHWAWSLGMDGKNYRTERDAAADAGTLAHTYIEKYLLGGGWPDDEPGAHSEHSEKAVNALREFVAWRETVALDIDQIEVPIVSEALRFGGTVDAVAYKGGERVLVDWKTSNRIYSDYIVQLGAYRLLWEEANPDDTITEAHCLRFDKELSNFTHHKWGLETLELGSTMFRGMRKMYDLDQRLKRAV